MNPRMSAYSWLSGCLALLLAAAPPAFAQTGSITGTVTQEGTGQPLSGALVELEGTNHQALSQANGRFLMLNVPAGSYTLTVQVLGHATFREQVTVAAGQPTTVNIVMSPEAIALQEVIVTGVVGATQKVRLPFTVDQISSTNLPVPAVNAATSIQGKVAGATVVQGSGKPGSPPSILLRGATSIDASGRSQEPLYIVDGVILGASMVDIDGLDIENIEIVKGAAAASLYGSRAANGVVQITTRRGRTIASDRIQYTMRSEYGRNQLSRDIKVPMTHFFKMIDGKIVDKDDQPCDYFETCSGPQLAGQKAKPGEAANVWNTYMKEEWPGKTYNQIDEFFDPGAFMQHYIAASGRSGATNFHISFSHQNDDGVMPGMRGFTRNNFRINLDQSVLSNLTISASSFISRSSLGEFGEASGNPLFHLTRMPAGVNLKACGDDPTKNCLHDPQRLVLQPDPGNSESPNPLYNLLVNDWEEKRGRFLGSVNVRYSPLSWLDIDGAMSYDRFESATQDLLPKGYRTIGPSQNNEGYLDITDQTNEAVNASVTASMRFNLAPGITNRTQFRYLYERADEVWNWALGRNFAVGDVPTYGNLDKSTLQAGSGQERTIADGYFGITNFEIFDRYFIDALLRNDGSSLFGENERRHWYGRVAFGWRMTEEPWFNAPFFNELKPRISFGTAGGRPNYEAQYETFSVSGGSVAPVALGNKDLKPEFSKELEAGIDALMLNGRLGVTVTYARTVTEDQILKQPLPSFMGYAYQYRNAGTLESKTWEASIDARLLQTDNFSWSARLNFDRTRSVITKMNIPAFTYGVSGQGLENVFWAREGEEIGTFYGIKLASSCADLPAGVDCSAFAVNNEGLLVYVGKGGSLADNNWGATSAEDGIFLYGNAVNWGAPIIGECTDRVTGDRTTFCPVGKTTPDYTIGISSTLNWKNFTLYGLVDATRGFDVYNQPLLWAIFKRWASVVDQRGVPEHEEKPLGYYEAIYAASGLNPNSYVVEDASYVKLREVALTYRLSSAQLSRLPVLNAFDGLSLVLTGRNLMTWSDYRGYDPEVGKGGGDLGSAALARVEGYQYPNFRTWTLGVELNF